MIHDLRGPSSSEHLNNVVLAKCLEEPSSEVITIRVDYGLTAQIGFNHDVRLSVGIWAQSPQSRWGLCINPSRQVFLER